MRDEPLDLRTAVAAADLPTGPPPLPVRPIDRSRYSLHRFLRRFRALAAVLVLGMIFVVSASAPEEGSARQAGGAALVLGGTLLVLGAVTVFLLGRGRTTDDQSLRQACAAHGWRLTTDDGYRLRARFPRLPLLSATVGSVDARTVDARSGPWLWWMIEERAARKWDVIGERVAVGLGRETRTSWVVWLPGADLPRWSVYGRDAADPQEWVREGLSFEVESFNRRYLVAHDREGEAYAHAMAHPRVIELIDRAMPDGARLDVAGETACLHHEGRLRRDQLDRNAAFLLAFAGLIPRRLLRGDPRRGGDETR